MSAITLTEGELEALTQYKLPTHQLNELRRQGFYRARMGRRGVVLERGHYEAVVSGRDAAPAKKAPTLRLA